MTNSISSRAICHWSFLISQNPSPALCVSAVKLLLVTAMPRQVRRTLLTSGPCRRPVSAAAAKGGTVIRSAPYEETFGIGREDKHIRLVHLFVQILPAQPSRHHGPAGGYFRREIAAKVPFQRPVSHDTDVVVQRGRAQALDDSDDVRGALLGVGKPAGVDSAQRAVRVRRIPKTGVRT